MDDQTYFARRPALAASFGMAEDADARFRALVQSPLRAGLLRYLNARPNEAFDVDGLMQAFGRLRLDVEKCVHELVDCGVAVEVTAPLVETHILNYSGASIYLRRVKVAFLRRIRDEQQFASLDALKKQIACDIDEARR